MLGALRRSLDQPRLDLELPAGDGLTVRIVERPALWMAPARLEALREDLRRVATSALGPRELDYGVFDPGSDALECTVVTSIHRRDDGRPVAFNALPLLEIELDGEPARVQHLGLVMIDPDTRGRGLSWALYGLTCFLLFLRGRCRPMWVSNVTQVPAVVGMVARTFSDVYPDPGRPGARPRFAHLQVARQLVRRHHRAFGVAPDVVLDEALFVLRDAYTGGSDHLKKRFDEAAKHRDEAYNDWCRDALDYARGDDVVQVGRIDLGTARRYLAKAVPGRTLGPLLVRALAMLVRHAALPVVHWADTSTRFGRLRPSGPRGPA